jgi:hypothetical protein
MLMTTADLAYMKGGASAQSGDTPEMALGRAAENRYIAPGPQRNAFVAGFLNSVGAPSLSGVLRAAAVGVSGFQLTDWLNTKWTLRLVGAPVQLIQAGRGVKDDPP